MPMYRAATLAEKEHPGFEIISRAGYDKYISHEAWPEKVAKGTCMVIEAPGPYMRCRIAYAVGCVLFESENNGYHDSDFFHTYWDEEKQRPVKELTGSTRFGWGEPNSSFVDATPEIKDKYKAWLVEQDRLALVRRRNEKAKELWAMRADILKAAKIHEVPYGKLLRVRKLFGQDLFVKALHLINSTRIRNGFKLSICHQIINWCKDENPKYDSPLSRRQRDCLAAPEPTYGYSSGRRWA